MNYYLCEITETNAGKVENLKLKENSIMTEGNKANIFSNGVSAQIYISSKDNVIELSTNSRLATLNVFKRTSIKWSLQILDVLRLL